MDGSQRSDHGEAGKMGAKGQDLKERLEVAERNHIL